MDEILKLHESSSEAVINKFSIFCASNTQMPFVYKKTLFEAAVMSSLLYSSETWLKRKTKVTEKQYNKPVKSLLGVGKNRSMNLCIMVTGIPPVSYR